MKSNENCAHIALNKSRQKEFDNSLNRKVYLENGDEFQIELFNPYHYTIGVSVTFNEEKEDNQLLILRPGERFWLDRYLTNPKKFKFSTYTIEDSKEAKEAISENGKVTIRFYKEEKPHKQQITTTTWTYPTWWNFNDWDIKYKYNYTCGDNSSVLKTRLFDSSINANYVSNATLSCSSNCSDSITSSLNSLNNYCIETGRVEEGSNSNQHFNEINKTFENYPFKTETINLLPKSQKPITTTELKTKYCFNCGRKLKDKFKYCPFCGTKQTNSLD